MEIAPEIKNQTKSVLNETKNIINELKNKILAIIKLKIIRKNKQYLNKFQLNKN